MMDFSRPMAAGDFSGRVGQTFNVQVSGHKVPLRLEAFQDLPGSHREGGSFRLEFVGPADPVLGQGVFPFLIDTEEYNIFIVPLGPDPRGMRYEALFY